MGNQTLIVSYSYSHVVRVDRKSKTHTSKSCFLRVFQATSHYSCTLALSS
jgi:hypothetical protein